MRRGTGLDPAARLGRSAPPVRTACWVCGTPADRSRTRGSCPVCGWVEPGASTGPDDHDDSRAVVLVIGATVLNLLILAALAFALLSSRGG